MTILTARTFQEDFHKLGVVNTRSENFRGKPKMVESSEPFAKSVSRNPPIFRSCYRVSPSYDVVRVDDCAWGSGVCGVAK